MVRLSRLMLLTVALCIALSLDVLAQYGPSQGTSPTPAMAHVDSSKQLTIGHMAITLRKVVETQVQERTRTVTDGNTQRQETYTVEVPFYKEVPVIQQVQLSGSLEHVHAREVAGKQVSVSDLAQRLSTPVMVLFASHDVPPDLLKVFKPETLLLILPSNFGYTAPPGPPGAPPESPPAPAAPSSSAAAQPPPAGGDAPPAPIQKLTSLPPTIRYAKIQGDWLIVRTQVRHQYTSTAYAQQEVDGQARLIPVQIDHVTLTQSGQRMRADAVQIQDSQNKPVPRTEAAKLLASERQVVVDDNPGDLDPAYLQILKSDVLALSLPSGGHGGYATGGGYGTGGGLTSSPGRGAPVPSPILLPSPAPATPPSPAPALIPGSPPTPGPAPNPPSA